MQSSTVLHIASCLSEPQFFSSKMGVMIAPASSGGQEDLTRRLSPVPALGIHLMRVSCCGHYCLSLDKSNDSYFGDEDIEGGVA